MVNSPHSGQVSFHHKSVCTKSSIVADDSDHLAVVSHGLLQVLHNHIQYPPYKAAQMFVRIGVKCK